MSVHLTPDEITSLLSGTANDPALERHTRECSACSAEVTHLRAALRQFRESVILTGERADLHGPIDIGLLASPSTPARSRLWPLTAVLAAFAVLLPVYVVTTKRNENFKFRSAAPPVIDDETLLNSVEARLSRRVPSAFEPMMQLMTVDWVEAEMEKDSIEEK